MSVRFYSGNGILTDPRDPYGTHETLTFAQRVAYQRAIEEVYWRHRIWPKENARPKPSLDAVTTQGGLEKKVRDYLRKSQALEDYWQRPITAEQLQAEMDRMAGHTQQPAVLRELFAALGDDPFVIAECLARPALAERLLSNWYSYDQRIHGELKRRAEAELRAHPTVEQMKQLSGTYSEIELVRNDKGEHAEIVDSANRTMKLNRAEWNRPLQKVSAMPIGKLGPLEEDQVRFYATAIIEKSPDHLKLATVTWSKVSLESWIINAENQMLEPIVMPSTNYTLSPISDRTDGCDDTWVSTAIPSTGRYRLTAVWTGSEMIVWGGEVSFNLLSNTGARYNPSTDSWAATRTRRRAFRPSRRCRRVDNLK